ncbi:MerR family transcriptional regulator [Erythrobacter sp.]|jgi:DNA-binding transcriptional MerR regulator|uniref:MerR family transcriptional regulator n=1 Tax=Erythrobacter sp. TaxID=1042 RepID=UPI002EA3416F|nr:MerR family transcriptional regulator [Erythrobacter sp.]
MARFDDGKDADALRTIGEVSEALGIKPHVLRYWEQQFARLKPLKRSGGRRLYRPADVVLLETIDRLVNREGYTLKGADAVLRRGAKGKEDKPLHEAPLHDRGAQVPGTEQPPREVPTPAIEDAIAQLKAIRARLSRAIDG